VKWELTVIARQAVLLDTNVAGKDATQTFFGLHRSEVLLRYGRYIIGTIENEKPKIILPTPGTLSPVPFAEPVWLTEGFKSPYYNDSHRRLQKFMRDFVDEHVKEEAREHERSGERPTVELIQKMGEAKINIMRMGPTKLLKGQTLPGDIKGENFDYFHEFALPYYLGLGVPMLMQDEKVDCDARARSIYGPRLRRRSPRWYGHWRSFPLQARSNENTL
jgi:hypothetical protein